MKSNNSFCPYILLDQFTISNCNSSTQAKMPIIEKPNEPLEVQYSTWYDHRFTMGSHEEASYKQVTPHLHPCVHVPPSFQDKS
jgi:uncharacterized protein YcfL